MEFILKNKLQSQFQLHPLLTLLVESRSPPQNSTLASKEFLFFLSVHTDKGELHEAPEKVYKGVSTDAIDIAVLTNTNKMIQ